MTIDGLGTGAVGIGTMNPTQAKLVVNGSENTTVSGYGYLNLNGNTGTASGSVQLSIYASSNIAGEGFMAFSDARIKNIKGVSNTANDLRTLSKIEITDYQLKDSITKGTKFFKKVIAQQVKEVYPQAVSNEMTDIIPNIYQLSKIKDGWIPLTADIIVGDTVKLIFSDTEELAQVKEISN